MKKFLRVFSIISISAILCCIISGCSFETTVVKAIVTKKEYVQSHYNYGYYFDGLKGKYRWKFKNFPAEYNVTVKYNDIVEIFDSEELFNEVEVGDNIDVALTTWIDDDGVVEDQYISIID